MAEQKTFQQKFDEAVHRLETLETVISNAEKRRDKEFEARQMTDSQMVNETIKTLKDVANDVLKRLKVTPMFIVIIIALGTIAQVFLIPRYLSNEVSALSDSIKKLKVEEAEFLAQRAENIAKYEAKMRAAGDAYFKSIANAHRKEIDQLEVEVRRLRDERDDFNHLLDGNAYRLIINDNNETILVLPTAQYFGKPAKFSEGHPQFSGRWRVVLKRGDGPRFFEGFFL